MGNKSAQFSVREALKDNLLCSQPLHNPTVSVKSLSVLKF